MEWRLLSFRRDLMIQLSNSTAQTLAPGQSLTFDSVLLKSGCAETHRVNSSIVTLRANCGIYEIHFTGNVSAPSASPVQLALQLDGETLPETTMNEEITTPGVGQNVAAATLIRTGCGCCGRVGVVNTGTTTLSVIANTSLFIKRVA